MTDHPRDPAHSDDTEAGRIPIGAVISQLEADFPDISVSKIRFLESRGLITPWRSASGFRRFDEHDIARLRWILTMQRDHFLPLRVIKERLDAGGADLTVEPSAPGTTTSAPKVSSSRFRPPGPASEDLEAGDLLRLAGINQEQLDALVKFGLVEATDTPDGPRFTPDEFRVARAAGAFLQRGIEARHLKAWRIAAEREAGMLEQIVVPMARQSGADASARARDTADELIDMGNAIREAIIVKVLRPGLGYSSD